MDIDVSRNGQHRFVRVDGRDVEREARLPGPGDGPALPGGDRLGPLQPSYAGPGSRIDRNTIVAVLDQEIRRLAPDLTAAA